MIPEKLHILSSTGSAIGAIRIMKKMRVGESFLMKFEIRSGEWVLSEKLTVQIDVDNCGQGFWVVTRIK